MQGRAKVSPTSVVFIAKGVTRCKLTNYLFILVILEGHPLDTHQVSWENNNK